MDEDRSKLCLFVCFTFCTLPFPCPLNIVLNILTRRARTTLTTLLLAVLGPTPPKLAPWSLILVSTPLRTNKILRNILIIQPNNNHINININTPSNQHQALKLKRYNQPNNQRKHIHTPSGGYPAIGLYTICSELSDDW